MKRRLLLLLFFLPLAGYSQNLVPNWSFEDTVSCPNDVAQVDRAVGWSAYRLTPDYFNSCSSSSLVGVPSNFAGNREPLNGNAYDGFVTFYIHSSSFDREYIGCQLTQALMIGEKYFVSFYVSRAANNFQQINIATNKIGMQFLTSSYSYANPLVINNRAQILTDSIITDTLNWVKISGSFIADSAYSNISIGNFFAADSTSLISFDTTAAFAYYYVDCVKVSTDSDYVNAISEYGKSNHIVIFPNPARGWVEISGSNIRSVSIVDLLGRECYNADLLLNSYHKIDVSSLSRGIYIIRVYTLSEVFQQKIILY